MNRHLLMFSTATVLVTVLIPFTFSRDNVRLREWQQPVNLGEVINSPYNERFPMISSDGLSLYFASDRPGGMAKAGVTGFMALDIYVSRRPDTDAAWSAPLLLKAPINTSDAEHSVAFSPDGHWMYFASNRPGGCGKHDLYISYRRDVGNDLGWEEPKNLGCLVNSSEDDSCPFFHVDKATGETWLYFVSTRKGGPGSWDVYASRLDEKKGVFGIPTLVKSLSSPEFDGHFDAKDGILWSGNTAGLGGGDLWITQKDEKGNWLPPENIGPPVNTKYNDGCFSLSADGTKLYFISDRPSGRGRLDLYVSMKLSNSY